MRALIVDDSKVMRKMIEAMIADYTTGTMQAGDGLEALAELEKGDPFDIAFVDWDMPNMNGLELVTEVRKRPEFDNMKLLMVTTHNSMDDVMAAMSQGVDDYLMKPVEEEAILDRLRMLDLID